MPHYPMAVAAPILYFENAAGCLYRHPAGYALIRYKPGPRKLAELQGLLVHARNLLTAQKWHRFLVDQSLLAPFNPEEVAWVVSHWSAASAQLPGGIFGAVVLAQNVFARLATSQLAHQANAQGMHFRLFETEAQAATWLRQMA
jgi:hypothetical protein